MVYTAVSAFVGADMAHASAVDRVVAGFSVQRDDAVIVDGAAELLLDAYENNELEQLLAKEVATQRLMVREIIELRRRLDHAAITVA